MDIDRDAFLPLIGQTEGFCHSCRNSKEYPFPEGPMYWCKAYALSMDQPQRRSISGCPRWKPILLSKPPRRRRGLYANPLTSSIIESEERLFAALNYHLDRVGLDLKTILLMAQPSLESTENLLWVDGLNHEDDGRGLDEVLLQMRALGYQSVCDVVDAITGREMYLNDGLASG